jgi:hypothetical protein
MAVAKYRRLVMKLCSRPAAAGFSRPLLREWRVVVHRQPRSGEQVQRLELLLGMVACLAAARMTTYERPPGGATHEGSGATLPLELNSVSQLWR